MKEFGLLNRLNGMDKLPYWSDAPCNSIRASEGWCYTFNRQDDLETYFFRVKEKLN